MGTEERAFLLEIAKRLPGYRRFRSSTTGGRRELLKLLQQGEIGAVFDFPSMARPSIPISREFWLDVRSGDFNNRLAWDTKKRQGRSQFLVEPAKFAEQYVRWFAERYLHVQSELSSDVSAELVSALRNMNSNKECFVLEGEWTRFVRDAGLGQVEHEQEVSKSPGGVKAFDSWEVVLVELAAILLAKQAQALSLEESKSQMATDAIVRATKIAKKGARIPEIDTVVRKINSILKSKNSLLGTLGDLGGHEP
jgi:hypothetical protein